MLHVLDTECIIIADNFSHCSECVQAEHVRHVMKVSGLYNCEWVLLHLRLPAFSRQGLLETFDREKRKPSLKINK